jgi:predicted nucleic acid-binding protein
MRLLIDANIILDILQDRAEFVDASSMIWKLCETDIATGYVSTLTFANLAYIMRKELTPDKINEVFKKLNLIFEFIDFNADDLSKASGLLWEDFEDAIQSAIAERINADYIITRNVRDFADSSVRAYTPSELLVRI